MKHIQQKIMNIYLKKLKSLIGKNILRIISMIFIDLMLFGISFIKENVYKILNLKKVKYMKIFFTLQKWFAIQIKL